VIQNPLISRKTIMFCFPAFNLLKSVEQKSLQ
jgi:hypothetical protein